MSDLGEVLTVAQLARRIGWSYDRMLNHLAAVNARTDGKLLRNVSRGTQRPRWTLTLGALKATHPEWFQRASLPADDVRVVLADHGERLEQLERISDLHTTAIARRVA